VVVEYFSNQVSTSFWERPKLYGVPFERVCDADNMGLVAPFPLEEIEEVVNVGTKCV